jgi:hypothetical protein
MYGSAGRSVGSFQMARTGSKGLAATGCVAQSSVLGQGRRGQGKGRGLLFDTAVRSRHSRREGLGFQRGLTATALGSDPGAGVRPTWRPAAGRPSKMWGFSTYHVSGTCVR